ncbi:DUF799 domain-containing protein [Acinetobacter larvae]|uniref:Lipoprotein n=1 Tax=Acinetobacter larvae TaxID=1789224 RepID=A0A1B2M2G6_9GAMM|nr:GNA1162 family protein [Acinetobacter larvae]AOA59396.1 hypothetical protein BFG52_14260 [Acinetobacter larvae]
MNKTFALLSVVVTCLGLSACQLPSSTIPSKDVSAYQAYMPRSILVLPPVNDSPDVKASYTVWSTVSVPVANAGYYVFPMAVVDRMFQENGVHLPAEAQSIDPAKLQQIFGADAALYIRIKDYGASYQVIQSVVKVAVEAKLVDLKTGTVLWQGKKSVTDTGNNNDSGLLGALIGALVDQIANNLQDRAYPLATSMSHALFTPTPTRPGQGLLFGPRSPEYAKQAEMR